MGASLTKENLEAFKGAVGDKGPPGDKGPRGEQGPRGEPGPAGQGSDFSNYGLRFAKSGTIQQNYAFENENGVLVMKDDNTGGLNFQMNKINNTFSFNGGNVGIGISTPKNKLEVEGTIKADRICLGSVCLYEDNLNLHIQTPNGNFKVNSIVAEPPAPVQGRCRIGEYEYGQDVGGFCCNVLPTNYANGQYNNCSGNVCALDANRAQNFSLCYPTNTNLKPNLIGFIYGPAIGHPFGNGSIAVQDSVYTTDGKALYIIQDGPFVKW